MGLSNGMEFVSLRDQYKLNDLLATSLFVAMFIYILDRLRYRSWEKSRLNNLTYIHHLKLMISRFIPCQHLIKLSLVVS